VVNGGLGLKFADATTMHFIVYAIAVVIIAAMIAAMLVMKRRRRAAEYVKITSRHSTEVYGLDETAYSSNVARAHDEEDASLYTRDTKEDTYVDNPSHI